MLTWTSKKPTVPGTYWHRRNEHVEIMVIRAAKNHLWATGLDQCGLFSQGSLKAFDGDWAGPLEPPTEA